MEVKQCGPGGRRGFDVLFVCFDFRDLYGGAFFGVSEEAGRFVRRAESLWPMPNSTAEHWCSLEGLSALFF